MAECKRKEKITMDIQKLKYDLSLQCAALDILWERYTDATPSGDYDIRTDIMDKLQRYYMHFSVLDQNRFEVLLDQLRKADQLNDTNKDN